MLVCLVLSQVDRAFDDESAVQEQRGIKRSASQGSSSLQEVVKRQKAWLTRYVGGERGGWRPQKQHRVSAKRWCAHVDNQVRHSAGGPGVIEFQRQDTPQWADWRLWPHLMIALDLGSDGLSGYMAMERKFLLNVDGRMAVMQPTDA